MSDVAVVHLASSSLGVEPFRDFLRSYREREAGVEHELLVFYNGFEGPEEPGEFAAELGDLRRRAEFRAPRSIDLSAYREAARRCDTRWLCFLNSGSVVLADGWLGALHRHAAREDVGVAGATGSWESHLAGLGGDPPSHHGPLAPVRRLADRWRLARDRRRHERAFAAFPNPHVRSNAFMMRRELMLSLDWGDPDDKFAAHALESGRASLTGQLLGRGLRCVVVGRDAEAYDPDDWPRSATFRAGEQANLLVADNRTRQYEEADPAAREALELAAWGRPE